MVKGEKLFVIDASVIIEGKYVDIPFKSMATVPEITKEIKDNLSGIKYDTLNISVKSPGRKYFEQVKEKSKEVNSSLSKPDLKLLALALDVDGVLVSDDYALLDLADRMNLEYKPFLTEGISENRTWKKICPGCEDVIEGKECPRCGLKAVEVVSSIRDRENNKNNSC